MIYAKFNFLVISLTETKCQTFILKVRSIDLISGWIFEMSHKYDSVFICKILISNEPTVKTVFRHFRIISERKKESRIKVETSVLRWPYFQFGLSNNYGANFYTWEFKKGCACIFWIVDPCSSNRRLRPGSNLRVSF